LGGESLMMVSATLRDAAGSLGGSFAAIVLFCLSLYRSVELCAGRD
jgi:hypothetical protein